MAAKTQWRTPPATFALPFRQMADDNPTTHLGQVSTRPDLVRSLIIRPRRRRPGGFSGQCPSDDAADDHQRARRAGAWSSPSLAAQCVGVPGTMSFAGGVEWPYRSDAVSSSPVAAGRDGGPVRRRTKGTDERVGNPISVVAVVALVQDGDPQRRLVGGKRCRSAGRRWMSPTAERRRAGSTGSARCPCRQRPVDGAGSIGLGDRGL
jgi:hypothetical protein